MEDVKPWVWDWTAIAAFIAAAVALFSAWRASSIAKANINSTIDLQLVQFREKWIQNLREKMVEFISIYATRLSAPEALKDLDAAGHSILLMMNPKDELYSELKDQIAIGVIKTIMASPAGVMPELPEVQKAMVDNTERYNSNALSTLCQKILKKEWDRLKSDLNKLDAKNK